jgi:Zn-dependent protease with chaperone function
MMSKKREGQSVAAVAQSKECRRGKLSYAWMVVLLMGMTLTSLSLASGPFDLSLEQEIAIGKQARALILSTHIVHAKASDYLARIGRRLISAGSWDPQFAHTYSFYVVEDPENPEMLNAFCAPGGFICFYRALFEDLLNNYGEDAVAAVLAHEIEHANRHHLAKQIKRDRERGFWAGLAAAVLGGILGGGERSMDIAFSLAEIYTKLQSLKYSRDLEDEADERGIVRLWRAGYDPKAMADVFNYLAHRTGSKPPEYLSTHPPEEERIKRSLQRAEILKQLRPGMTVQDEIKIIREGKKIYLPVGWVHGLTPGMSVEIAGKTFKLSKVYFDRAEVDVKEKDAKNIPDDANAILKEVPTPPHAQPVGVGTVLKVNPEDQTVLIDLGAWHGIQEGMNFRIYSWRFEEQAQFKGKTYTVRVARVIAECQVQSVGERESVLKVVSFRNKALEGTPGERYTIADIAPGDEARWSEWLLPKPTGK